MHLSTAARLHGVWPRKSPGKEGNAQAMLGDVGQPVSSLVIKLGSGDRTSVSTP